MTKSIGSFHTDSCGILHVHLNEYKCNDALAVELLDENDERLTPLSDNYPNYTHELKEGEFFVEQSPAFDEIKQKALLSGMFKEVGQRSEKPYLPIWSLAPHLIVNQNGHAKNACVEN